MSKDYRDGYKDGFKDGFEAGQKSAPKNNNLNDWVFGKTSNQCSVCGRVWQPGVVYGYVCSNINCPSMAKAYTTGQLSVTTTPEGHKAFSQGAVGSLSMNEMPKGANGPAGYSRPTTKEEQDRLDHYNQVWINGQWAELGS
jgi:hypothetical protein